MKISSRYWSLVVLVLFVAVTLVFFWRITFSGMILARGDVYNYFYPLWDVRSAVFQAGHIPLWSPDIFMGVPLLANSQLGTFYPPNWLVTPFEAPTAITLSLLAHTVWALLGTYLLARRTLALDRVPAIVAGVVFGLGGYLGGQSEHINQLQALSWMPWVFLVVSYQSTGDEPSVNLRGWRRYRVSLGGVLLFAACVALQLLAGHPQTVFITLVGIGLFGLSRAFGRRSSATSRWNASFSAPDFIRFVVLVALGGILGLMLSAPQLIPMLELSGLGNRGGGLDPQKVLAFSFTPLLMGRGLLPSYDGLLFGEYIAYSGVIGLGLAIIGLLSRQPENQSQRIPYRRLPYILLIVVGFTFALGAFNPLNWLLATLPGFSFFRVPARWMALEALGVAALAGVGLQTLKSSRPQVRTLVVVVVVIGGLAAASTLAGRQAVDVIGSAVPTVRSWVGWGVALVVLLLVSIGRTRLGAGWVIGLMACAAVVELFMASQIMPINLTAPRDVYTASRFSIRQLQQYDSEYNPPGRLLSISPLEFDPGDKEALNARYAALGMDALSTRIALVATKLREVVGPNLGMRWGIPSIDGFDGGLLPTRYYSAFSTLLLPEGVDSSTDGRLREMLALPECRGACIPDQAWLNLSNTRYLITDKTADVVNDGVFYDTSLSLLLAPNQTVQPIRVDPVFTTTVMDVLYSSESCTPAADCTPLYEGQAPTSFVSIGDFTRARWELAAPQKISSITLAANNKLTVHAVTLVDSRSKAFQQVTLPPWKRVLSSDIKLYENANVTPRAFFVAHQAVQVAADSGAAVVKMREALNTLREQGGNNATFAPAWVVPDYVPQEAVNVSGSAERGVTITSYSPERVEVHVEAGDAAGLLVLSDAYYPGWIASVNGSAASIYRTNIMFRGVAIPAGESSVIFEFKPWWWPGIPLLGLAAWGGLLLLGLGCLGKYRPFV